MSDSILKIGCLVGLLAAWGVLVFIGKADAAPLVTFIQTTAYAMVGVVAHSFVTKGNTNAQVPPNSADAGFVGLRLPAVNREPPAIPDSPATPKQ